MITLNLVIPQFCLIDRLVILSVISRSRLLICFLFFPDLQGIIDIRLITVVGADIAIGKVILSYELCRINAALRQADSKTRSQLMRAVKVTGNKISFFGVAETTSFVFALCPIYHHFLR